MSHDALPPHAHTATWATVAPPSSAASTSHIKDGAIDLLAGTMGGIANVYAGQPLDTVKVKQQAFPSLHPSWTRCAVDTWRLDGIRGLYAGTVPALAANIAENAVLFTAYGYCQKTVAYTVGVEDVATMSSLQNASAGSLAAVFAALVLCPTELVKCRLQAQRELHANKHSTPISVCRDLVRAGGVRALFTGMVPTLAREVPGYACFFGCYEATRFLLARPGQSKDDIGLARTAISGAAGGVALWTTIYPADVIKSRMQISGGNAGEVLRHMLKNDGITGLYRGLTPTLIRTCAASGALFIAYEYTKKLLNAYI